MIIDFNKTNGGGSLANYWNSAVTEEHIESAASITYASGVSYTDAAIAGIDLSNYALSADVTSLSAATAGKADAANITPNGGAQKFPKWNSQGIITGEYSQVFYPTSYYINGTRREPLFNRQADARGITSIYAPESAGTAGEILVSTGSGAPVWSAVTFDKTIVDFDKTSQAERATLYATLKALYDGGSGATINKDYDFYKTVGTKQGLKIDYYTFSADNLVFGKVVSPDTISEQAVYAQVLTIDSAGTVAVVTNTVGGGSGVTPDMSAYWTSSVTKTYVDSAITGVEAHIGDVELVAASAITDLKSQLDVIDQVIPAAIVDLQNNKVGSASISTIWKGTQAEYDAATQSGATADSATFYIIVPNPSN